VTKTEKMFLKEKL